MRHYLRHLSSEILDEHNLFVELLLAWIAGMLTLIVFSIVVSIIAAWVG